MLLLIKKIIIVFFFLTVFCVSYVQAATSEYDSHDGVVEHIDTSENIGDILSKMRLTKEKIIRVVKEKKLDEIHKHSVVIYALSKKLLKKTECPSEGKIQDVCEDVNRLMRTTESFHGYADQGNQRKTFLEGLKLAKIFKLVEQQYLKKGVLTFKKGEK